MHVVEAHLDCHIYRYQENTVNAVNSKQMTRVRSCKFFD